MATPGNEHPAIAAWREAGGTGDITPQSRAAYFGLVKRIDRICGRVFDLVKDQKNTVSIYTSDRDECLGERGLWWKRVMYDQSTKIPMIFRGSDVEAQRTDDRVASLVDLSATILDFAQAASLPEQSGQTLFAKPNLESVCFSSYYGGLMNIALPDLRHRMVRHSPQKLVWFDGSSPLLFDLEADPDELADLSDDPKHAETLAELTSRVLQNWLLAQITRQQMQSKARIAVIREWVRTSCPPEPTWWIDPNLDRKSEN